MDLSTTHIAKVCISLFNLSARGSFFLLLGCSAAIAQIIPDNTLSENSQVPRRCTNCEITGGTQAGSNLFHSFLQFSVPNRGVAYFNNSLDIQNIFARVTGQGQSNINGTIRANGSANVFLLNPNGIIFGPNAVIDIGGSFLATTAESIQFENFQFSATNPQSVPLLTISSPIGLQLGTTSASIINRSQASHNGSINTAQRPVGLQVASNQSLTLLGNGIALSGGNLTARGGQVHLVSVAPSSFIPLRSEGAEYLPEQSSNTQFRDISLTNGSYIDTSGSDTRQSLIRPNGGAVRLQGRNISLSDRARIISRTYQGDGEDLQLRATGSITLARGSIALAIAEEAGRAGDVIIQADQTLTLSDSNTFSNTFSLTLLGSQAFPNTGFEAQAGNVIVEANRVLIQAGARIEASTFGAGAGGSIQIQAASVEVIGFSPDSIDGNRDGIPRVGELGSGIFSQTEGAGNAGNLSITTGRLVALDGGVVSTATFAEGNGGEINIQASDSVVLRGASPAVERNFFRSGIFISASDPAATGQAGALTIRTNHLVVGDRADISARNEGFGNAGAINLLGIDRLQVQDGGEIRSSTLGFGSGGRLTIQANSIDLSGQAMIGAEVLPSTVTALAAANSFGDAGDLSVTTTNLTVRDGAEMSVSAAGTGTAGNLQIQADAIYLDAGRLVAETRAGETPNANIQLQVRNVLVMQNQSRISAQAFNNAAGGNVAIRAPDGFVIAPLNENNDIVANAFRGQGGNIAIEARSIIGLEERSSLPFNNGTNDIDASSQFGISGAVGIIQSIADPSQGATELPANTLDATQQIARRCGGTVQAGEQVGAFVISGRGGLPSTPENRLRNPTLTPGLITLEADTNSSDLEAIAPPTAAPTPIEATGWIIDSTGQAILVASTPDHQPVPPSTPCPPGH